MSTSTPIQWRDDPNSFKGDIGATVAFRGDQWLMLGAKFSRSDDGQGETPNIAVGTIETTAGRVDFGVLDYGQERTFLLVPARGARKRQLVSALAIALERAGTPPMDISERSGFAERRPTASPTESRNRWLALCVLCAGMLMITLDGTIVSVALPSIQEDLGFSQSNLAWVVDAYAIPFGGLILLAGRLGDLLGTRRVFLTGLTIFTVASLLCAASPVQGMLVGARFVQGFGGAMVAAVILTVIVRMFPEPRDRAKAFGVYIFVATTASSIGLLLGGVLTETIGWQWIFIVNLPIGIAVAYLARRLVDNPNGIGLGAGADYIGATLITAALVLAVFTILQTSGASDTHTFFLGTASILLLGIFIARQSRTENPLMPLRLFASRNVVSANFLQILLIIGMLGMFFLGPLYLQRVLGYTALQVGLALLPTTVVMGMLSFGFSGQLVTRFGPRATLIPGAGMVVVALLLLARTPVHGHYLTDLLPPFLLIAIGLSISFPSAMTLAIAGVPTDDAGLASGLANASTRVGGALGLAVLATVSAGHTNNLLGEGTSRATALTFGFHLAYLIAAGLAAIAVAIALFVLKDVETTTTETAAAGIEELIEAQSVHV